MSNEESFTNPVKCLICGKDDHVEIVIRKGKKAVNYFSCAKFVMMAPSEWFSELRQKTPVYQCLYPGSKGNHDGMCINQYSCKHGSHRGYKKSKHVRGRL